MNQIPESKPAFGPAFWMVYVHGRQGPTRHHDSYESARNEAERLARQNPGARVSVLAEMGTCRTVEPCVRWEW